MPVLDRAREPDRLLTMSEACYRSGYHEAHLRKLMRTSPNPPPLRKRGGRWTVWLSELDAWIDGSMETTP